MAEAEIVSTKLVTEVFHALWPFLAALNIAIYSLLLVVSKQNITRINRQIKEEYHSFPLPEGDRRGEKIMYNVFFAKLGYVIHEQECEACFS